jgi:hypothetical protein
MRDTLKPSSYDPLARAAATLCQRELHFTLGEFFADGSSIDVIYQRGADQLELVYVRGDKTTIDAMIEVQGRDYEPAPLNWTFVRSTEIPSRIDPSYGSTSDLFAAARDLFTRNGFADEVSLSTALFSFSTWFNELLPVAPCLAISGPRPEAMFLLDLVACVSRRPMRFASLDRAVLGSLPFDFRPTLLLSHQSAGRKAQELLSISDRPGCQLPWGTSVVNASLPKAIYGGTRFTYSDGGGCVIPVHLVPIRGHLPLLSAGRRRQIADEFQPKLLSYRARNHRAVSESEFDLPASASETRILGSVLGSCIAGAPEVRDELRRMLSCVDEELRAERCCDPRSVAGEVLLTLAHRRQGDKIYVGEVSKMVEELQKSREETGTVEPRKIGDVLRSIGIHPRRDRNGYSIVLSEKLRRQIHELASEFDIAVPEESTTCSLCSELQA